MSNEHWTRRQMLAGRGALAAALLAGYRPVSQR